MNINTTLSFDDVRAEVVARADKMLPDVTIHASDLAMTHDGHLDVPGVGTLRLNAWSRRQLSADLGLRWDKWFASATPDERAEEVNRRLARLPGELKLRAYRDESGEADGVLRALLSPSFTPIDDVRIFDRLAANLGSALDVYRFTEATITDSTSHYAAVRVAPLDVRGDVLRPGFRTRNSEVGGSAFSMDDYWLRQVCTNGLMLKVGDKRLLYRTHRTIDDDHLAAALVIALGKLPERWSVAADLMARAMDVAVPHPDAAVAAVLDSPDVPRAFVEAAQVAALRDEDHTRYGVVQAITLVAHRDNRDPDVRFAMERLAGEYLAAAA